MGQLRTTNKRRLRALNARQPKPAEKVATPEPKAKKSKAVAS